MLTNDLQKKLRDSDRRLEKMCKANQFRASMDDVTRYQSVQNINRSKRWKTA